jgi:hypothetical protein
LFLSLPLFLYLFVQCDQSVLKKSSIVDLYVNSLTQKYPFSKNISSLNLKCESALKEVSFRLLVN